MGDRAWRSSTGAAAPAAGWAGDGPASTPRWLLEAPGQALSGEAELSGAGQHPELQGCPFWQLGAAMLSPPPASMLCVWTLGLTCILRGCRLTAPHLQIGPMCNTTQLPELVGYT